MKRLSFMVIAGEPSGDTLAAELVQGLRLELVSFQAHPTPDHQPLFTSLEPVFFGAGGSKLAAAGVELDVDMTAHAVFGLVDVFKRLGQFFALRERLKNLAIERQPDVIICVDYAGFNRRLARAIKDHVRANRGTFRNWNPRIVQFISPQVWASRPGRTKTMAEDLDLLISIFPFEKPWYAERVPQLKVEYVGHPMLDRYSGRHNPSGQFAPGFGVPASAGEALEMAKRPDWCRPGPAEAMTPSQTVRPGSESNPLPTIVLLPGSRPRELKRHLPVMGEAAKLIQANHPASWRMVLPSESLAQLARPALPKEPEIKVQVGGLADVLAQSDLALASSGTVTMECAFFGVPAVVVYKVSWPEYEIGRRIVQVKHIAMPNLLAKETLFPEFLQHHATPANAARAALELLSNLDKRNSVKHKLAQVIASLGEPGAARRAARAIVGLLG